MARTKLFFDTEFTGLHKNTTLISIGIVAETGDIFYAEFNDYDKSQVNEWIEENVIKNLEWHGKPSMMTDSTLNGSGIHAYAVSGDTQKILKALKDFLAMFESVEMWSDCLHYDWVLFCDLFGGAMAIPENVYYIPFDICTLLHRSANANFDADINREEFIEYSDSKVMPSTGAKHNALYDAYVIRQCFNLLYKEWKEGTKSELVGTFNDQLALVITNWNKQKESGIHPAILAQHMSATLNVLENTISTNRVREKYNNE